MSGEITAYQQISGTQEQLGGTAENKGIDPAKGCAYFPKYEKCDQDHVLKYTDQELCMLLFADIEVLCRKIITGQADSSPSKVH